MFIAEREGFEPPVPCSTTVFKTAAIDHSATSPKERAFLFESDAKVVSFFFPPNFIRLFFEKIFDYLFYIFIFKTLVKIFIFQTYLPSWPNTKSFFNFSFYFSQLQHNYPSSCYICKKWE